MHWNSSSSYWLKFHYTEIMFWVFWCLRSECPLWGTKTEISRTGWGKTFDMVSSHGSPLHICHIVPLTQDLQAFIHLLAVFNFSETFLSFWCLNLTLKNCWFSSTPLDGYTCSDFPAQLCLWCPFRRRLCSDHHSRATVGKRHPLWQCMFSPGAVQANNTELWWRKSRDEGPIYSISPWCLDHQNSLEISRLFLFFSCGSHNQKCIGLWTVLIADSTVLGVQIFQKLCSPYFIFPISHVTPHSLMPYSEFNLSHSKVPYWAIFGSYHNANWSKSVRMTSREQLETWRGIIG